MRYPLRPLIVAFFWLVLAPSLEAAPPNLTDWLYQNPEVSGKIVWQFPDQIPELSTPELRRLPTWMGRAFHASPSAVDVSGIPSVSNGSAAGGGCPGGSCPIPPGASLGPGKTLQWYYWPPDYKARLQTHFNRYWQWMETAWPLYRQYQQGGYAEKPAGFEARFGSELDPDTGARPQNLPIVAEVMKDSYTHVLYDPAATADLYLKVVALQLAMELSGELPWKFRDHSETDISLLLDGRRLFRYFPAGSRPWGGLQTVEREGYDAEGTIPIAPLAAINFIFRHGLLRETRFATVAQLLEWERFNLQHAMGNPQSLVGECGKEFSEVYWGVKGNATLPALMFGTVMACRLVPQPGSDTNPYYSSELAHYTGGCGGTGNFSYRVLRFLNLPAEKVAFTHGQMRFVVERAPFEQMLAALEPVLPADPAIDDGLSPLLSRASLMTSSFALASPPSRGAVSSGKLEKGADLANAYLDHNDNPYGMEAIPEVPMQEALISEATYQRWFRQPPASLSDEQRSVYMNAHGKRVSLRPVQLRIARLPLHLFKYYCWKEDAGKPYAETETYKNFFDSKYTPAELEATGFWQRFEAKLAEYGGCEGVPPMW